jgi:hypothetical protein
MDYRVEHTEYAGLDPPLRLIKKEKIKKVISFSSRYQHFGDFGRV